MTDTGAKNRLLRKLALLHTEARTLAMAPHYNDRPMTTAEREHLYEIELEMRRIRKKLHAHDRGWPLVIMPKDDHPWL